MFFCYSKTLGYWFAYLSIKYSVTGFSLGALQNFSVFFLKMRLERNFRKFCGQKSDSLQPYTLLRGGWKEIIM